MPRAALLLHCLASLASAFEISLPASTTGQVRILSLATDQPTPKPVARSYDGNIWERTQGGATLDLQCSQAGSCVATIPDGTTYDLDAHDAPPTTADQLASRFLVQASFGPTPTSIQEVDASSTAGLQSWISTQIALPASYHRIYYRERVNPRAFASYPTGALRATCEAGSRWHRFAFTRGDCGTLADPGGELAVAAAATADALELRIAGLVRTEVLATSYPELSAG